MHTLFTRLLSPVLLMLLLCARLSAAAPVTGQVVDPDGRGVPGAAVILTDGTAVLARTRQKHRVTLPWTSRATAGSRSASPSRASAPSRL